MFVASKKGKEKVYHAESCYQVKKMNKQNKLFFHSEREAKDAGFRACNCCHKLVRKYQREKKEIQDICSKHNMRVKLHGGELYIDTCIESWKIVITERKRCMVLLHANKGIYRLKPRENGVVLHNYHLQKDIRSTTIANYLKYIWKHDEWLISGERENQYKSICRNSRRGKKEYRREKARAKKQAVLRVCNMIERLENNSYMEGAIYGA